ncbi:MAG TPA: TlpA disulfide reductase family protein [Pseudosphingobacterium sp.]|nr:TlpA disulfide reductase family protein [Pseudosphingobacterium sp.]
MKLTNTFLTIFFTLFSLVCSAKFHLSGKIRRNSSITLKVNIPSIYTLNKTNDLLITVNEEGRFSLDLPINEQKFAHFFIDNKSYILLLRPDKDLNLEIDEINHTILNFMGSAAPENQVLYAIDINKIPFFMERENETYRYSKTNPNEVQDLVVLPWLKERNQRLTIIEKSTLTETDKNLLKSEVYYNCINYLSDFVGGIVRWKQSDWRNFIINLCDSVSANPIVDNPGIQYYVFIDKYIAYMEAKAFNLYNQDTSIKKLRFFNLSIDSGRTLANEKGEIYLSWLVVHQNFSNDIAEKYLAQLITDQYRYKELKPFKSLMSEFDIYFPKSPYLKELRNYDADLHTKLTNNLNNKSIELLDNYDTVKSIYNIVNRFKGKVIYLDIWGTWCGPCKDELTFVPALKEKFKDEELIFLYLDMDQDTKDQEWQDFIRINEMTGIHLRMNNEKIQAIWQELLPNQKGIHGQYPSYFIFDKGGDLIKEKAKRPSDGEKLYSQLKKYL